MAKMHMARQHKMTNKKKKIFFGIYPQDEDRFAGEYIAIVKGKIVAHGKDPRNVYKRANKFSSKPLFTVVPSGGWKQMRILCLK